jgi:hypothetical protein
MTCEECEKMQERAFGGEEFPFAVAYYRIDGANVAIVGCEKHVRGIIMLLRLSAEVKQ